MDLLICEEVLYQRIKNELDRWERLGEIRDKDIYALLHTIKESTETNQLLHLTEKKIAELEQFDGKLWRSTEWGEFLSPVIEMFIYGQQENIHNSEMQSYKNNRTAENEIILIIDDDLSFISNMKMLFEREGYSVIIANNGKRGIDLIYQMHPAIVFLNAELPYFTRNTLSLLMRKISKSRTFIAIICEYMELDFAAEAYEFGAMDYIPKPLSDRLALAYVKNRLTYQRELEYAIVTDELTKAYNRKYLEIEMNQLINRYKNRQELFAVVIIDLDDFKKINDTYGHLVGDDVLKELASIIMRMIRPADILFRYGGEEFILLCPDTTSAEAYAIIEKIRRKIEVHQFTAGDDKFYVTFSVGIVTIHSEFLHCNKLIGAGDRALSAAKMTGKNQTIIYDSSIANINVNKKLKVIIIDDVRMIREMIKDRFEHLNETRGLNIEISLYEDGYQFLQSNWYHPSYQYIILLDWLLPKMDGIEVLEEIRKKYSPDKVFISMLTGKTGEESIIEALNKGADDYISKPFQVNEIVEKVLHLAKRSFER